MTMMTLAELKDKQSQLEKELDKLERLIDEYEDADYSGAALDGAAEDFHRTQEELWKVRDTIVSLEYTPRTIKL
jgi:DNA repair exonuclease SbcCD ATPase subunit